MGGHEREILRDQSQVLGAHAPSYMLKLSGLVDGIYIRHNQ
jgi:hypothetical protein